MTGIKKIRKYVVISIDMPGGVGAKIAGASAIQIFLQGKKNNFSLKIPHKKEFFKEDVTF
jgi:hypothetical protein